MATANDEFEDLMPHRLKVHGKETKYDSNGAPIPNSANSRTYRCLFDDSASTARDVDGTTITIGATAYVAPVPENSGDGLPVDIESDEVVEILSPRPQTRPVMNIERHYDMDGQLHNIVLRFT